MTPAQVMERAPTVDRTPATRRRKSVTKRSRPKPTVICNAFLPSGRTCRREAGMGTDHPGAGRCDQHGGNTPDGISAAGIDISRNLLRSPVVMGVPVDMEPVDALLWCVAIAAGEVHYLTARVAELDEEELIGRPTTVTREKGKGDRGYRDLRTTSGGPHELHILVKERQRAVDRLARFSKMALDAGVAERQVRVAEAQAGMLAALITGVMEDIGATKRQMTLLEKHLPSRLLALEASRP